MKRTASSASRGEVVLFAVTGMSPAVLTETVWALAHEKPSVVPDRVVVLTTRRGFVQVRAELLAPRREFGKAAVWDALRDALDRKGLRTAGRLRFGDTGDDIRVFTAAGPAGRTVELEDIRTAAENAAAADFILGKLREFTENPDVRVIASIAGGRKTMSALLYACMTLIGRETDRLTHVLVNDPYDSDLEPRFYFPDQRPGTLKGRNGRSFKACNARVELADIPFVPLRNRFRELERMPGGFSSLVRQYAKDLKTEGVCPRVRIDREAKEVWVNGTSVPLRTRALLVLEYLVELSRIDAPPTSHKEAVDPLKAFMASHPSADARNWSGSDTLLDDLKRELSYLRRAFDRHGVSWGPGLRADSLRLPPFEG